MASVASAGVVAFESLHSDPDPYSPGREWRTPGSVPPSERWGLAYRFVPLASGTVESMELGVFVTLPSLAGLPLTVSIHSDVGGWIAEELGSGTMTAHYAPIPNPLAPVSVSPDTAISLIAGQPYWLSVQGDSATTPAAWVRWYRGDSSVEAMTYSASVAMLGGGPTWGIGGIPPSPGAFQLLVPSPSVAVCLSVAGLAAAARRRRH